MESIWNQYGIIMYIRGFDPSPFWGLVDDRFLGLPTRKCLAQGPKEHGNRTRFRNRHCTPLARF